jgi:hypothetical protein
MFTAAVHDISKLHSVRVLIVLSSFNEEQSSGYEKALQQLSVIRNSLSTLPNLSVVRPGGSLMRNY